MKIYFAGSIRGGRDDQDLYLRLIDHLKKYGEVLTEHVGDRNLTSYGETISDPEIHDRDMNWLGLADVIVADVTTSSTGVGYEIGRIVERNKHVEKDSMKYILCLYHPEEGKKLSAMINGSDSLMNVEYKDLEEAVKHIDNFFSYII